MSQIVVAFRGRHVNINEVRMANSALGCGVFLVQTFLVQYRHRADLASAISPLQLPTPIAFIL